jgi:ABC-type transporter Mla subunit MlaD
MIHNVGRLSQVLSERDDTLRGLVRDGSSVLGATADQRVGLDGLLRELPPTLQELDTSFKTVRAVLPAVDTAVQRLDPVATELPSGLSSLRAVSADAKPAVRALQTPLARLVPLAKDLRPFSKSLSGTVDAVLPQLPDVDKAFKDIAGCHLAAYMFFQWTASITKFDDAMGAYPVGDFGFGADSISGLKDPARTASPSCASGAPLGATP